MALLPTWQQNKEYNVLPSGGSSSSLSSSHSSSHSSSLKGTTPEWATAITTNSAARSSQRRRRIALGLLGAAVVLVTVVAAVQLTSETAVEPVIPEVAGWTKVTDVAVDVVEGEGEMWGWTEQMGWVQREEVGLIDLGEIAESRYHLGIDQGERGTEEYFTRLYTFAKALPRALRNPFLTSLHSHLPPSHANLLRAPARPYQQLPAMVSYKRIHQTDKTADSLGDETEAWRSINEPDGWAINFFDDDRAARWVQDKFADSEVAWAWDYMHRGVLRADFLRYLVPLVDGGVYSDIDTRPLRPIEQWGKTRVEYLDLSATDGENWKQKLSTNPSVIVAIDVDVHAHPTWFNGWPRPLGICQWTLSSAPNHPIFLDAARRVVNATRVVETWEDWRAGEVERLDGEGNTEAADSLRGQGRDHAMSVMEWTGPGLFSDSVMAFLLARYNVTWHRLRGLDHPLRIGDVMILPITAFSPGGEKDFGAQGPDSPQANVLHDFRGSWKSEGW